MFSANSTQVVSSSPSTPGSLYVSTTNNDQGTQGLNTVTGTYTGAQLLYPSTGIAQTIQGAAPDGSAISSGTANSFFIKEDGSLWGIGNNGNSQLGLNGDTQYQATPVFVDAGPWAWVANANNVSAGIKSDGTLWTWGVGSSGQLGHGNTLACTSPVIVGARTDWVQVRVMVTSMVALRSDNTLWGWGTDTYGQLGQGTAAKTSKSSPIQIAGSWSAISCTSQSTVYGIRTDGSLWSWGRNLNGALGLNLAATGHRSSPVQIGAATDWAEVNTMYTAALARKTNGQVWAWGLGTNGQLGDNARISRSSPVQVAFGGTAAKAYGLWDYAQVIIDTSGNAWTCGLNDGGMLLWDNTITPRSSPVQVGTGYAAQAPICFAGVQSKVPAKVASIALKTNGDAVFTANGNYFNVLMNRAMPPSITTLKTSPVWAHGKMAIPVVSGGPNSCLAIKTDGTLWAWGYNNEYQLGLGDLLARSSPVQVGVATTWSQVAAGVRYAGAVRTDGTLWMWGSNNSSGCLGNQTTASSISPVQLGALTTWAQVACSSNTSALGATTLAIKTDGTLWGWGGNDSGQIGDNTKINRSSPVQVGVAVGAQYNWKQVSVNGSSGTSGSDTSSLGVKTDGTLWAWGSNKWGSLGLGAASGSDYPIQVGAGTNWSKVVVGQTGTVAIKTDGTLWCWGQNGSGQIGDNTVIAKSSPVQVGALTDWVDCYKAQELTVGVRSNGTMWIWGGYANYFRGSIAVSGQNTSSPVQVTSGASTGTTGWKSVVIGGSHITSYLSLMATKE